MSKLFWYLIIKSLDQRKKEDVKIFDTLFNVCKNSRYACLKISNEVYSKYLNYINKPMFIWKEIDSWPQINHGRWHITEYKPNKKDANIIFRGTINNVLNIRNKNLPYNISFSVN